MILAPLKVISWSAISSTTSSSSSDREVEVESAEDSEDDTLSMFESESFICGIV